MTASPNLGDLLRTWRKYRGKSQLDLSLDAGVSQRHISFVESGRASPSRELLLALSQALMIPLRDRNALLLAAGYAPLYAEAPWDAPEMAAVGLAIERVLQQQEPYPALVLDRHWNILKVNTATPVLFSQFIDLAAFPRPRNLLHLVFNPAALRPFIEDWQQVASGLLDRLFRESVAQVLDPTSIRLLRELRAYPGAANLRPRRGNAGPVIPITFRKGDHRSSWFSLVTTVGTPQYISAQELRIECMFPADPAPSP